mmetsp:Transcript_43103/g.111719  ORF Transcript_43103/g.111719 Transcript_43103/m.111719 type:complete len:132 (+) Transcript_43103:2700-3095(+)
MRQRKLEYASAGRGGQGLIAIHVERGGRAICAIPVRWAGLGLNVTNAPLGGQEHSVIPARWVGQGPDVMPALLDGQERGAISAHRVTQEALAHSPPQSSLSSLAQRVRRTFAPHLLTLASPNHLLSSALAT